MWLFGTYHGASTIMSRAFDWNYIKYIYKGEYVESVIYHALKGWETQALVVYYQGRRHLWDPRQDIDSEVVVPVIMKSSNFWHVTPCSPLKFHRYFGGECRLRLQRKRISRARNQRESPWRHFQRTTWRYIPGARTKCRNAVIPTTFLSRCYVKIKIYIK
jgi:hypothetical protein